MDRQIIRHTVNLNVICKINNALYFYWPSPQIIQFQQFQYIHAISYRYTQLTQLSNKLVMCVNIIISKSGYNFDNKEYKNHQTPKFIFVIND